MHAKLEQRSFLVLLILVTVLFLFLLKPFFGAVFWACALTILFYPLQKYLNRRWPKWPNAAALVTLLATIFVGIIPAIFLLTSFLQEGIDLYHSLQTSEIDPGAYIDQIRHAFPAVESLMKTMDISAGDLKAHATSTAVTFTRFIAEHAVQLGQGALRFFISLGIMLYINFFLLRDGHTIINLLIRALPLGDERERLLFSKFAEVTRATIKGNLVVAIVQGSLGGFIFWSLGISNPLLWGAIMAVLAMIPVVGTSLIWIPVAIYLFAIGDWSRGLILVAFGAGVIGLVDNLLRPLLIGRDTKLPDYIVLLSTLGGIAMFGINGFVIGPLIASLFFAFWQIFMKEFNPQLEVETENELLNEETVTDGENKRE